MAPNAFFSFNKLSIGNRPDDVNPCGGATWKRESGEAFGGAGGGNQEGFSRRLRRLRRFQEVFNLWVIIFHRRGTEFTEKRNELLVLSFSPPASLRLCASQLWFRPERGFLICDTASVPLLREMCGIGGRSLCLALLSGFVCRFLGAGGGNLPVGAGNFVTGRGRLRLLRENR